MKENVPEPPAVNVVGALFVIDGVWSTTSVKDCVAPIPMPFVAVTVIGYGLPLPDSGVPESRPLAESATPVGSDPVSENAPEG